MKKVISPIKYYGGKYYITKVLLEHFPANYSLYVEVFGGSASLLFAKKIDKLEIYNDLEKGVYSLFRCLSDKKLFEELKEKLDLTYYHKEIRDHAFYGDSMVDKAANFFVRNRMSYNGVGGFSRNLIIRRKMSKSVSDYLSAIDRLPEIHQRLSSVIIENEPWEVIVNRYDKETTFMYMDPPYLRNKRLSNQTYLLDMNETEHYNLIDKILRIKSMVLLSGYDNPIYKKLERKGWKKVMFKSPNARSNAIECIWKNYE